MKCTQCREDVCGEAIMYKGKPYCCDACAFEASLRLGSICGSQTTVEAGLRYGRGQNTASGAPDPQPKTCGVIAIDGPVAGGKTSVGRLVARKLGYLFVDTGAMYRALTWKALQTGTSPEDSDSLNGLAQKTRIELLPSEQAPSGYRALVDGVDATEAIRKADVESAVSLVSRVPAVRRQMVEKQRELAKKGALVMVGRDIATCVLPEADLKVFLTATAQERARRRGQELLDANVVCDLERVLRDLTMRDTIDSYRIDSPLKPAADSKIIETDGMSLQQVVDRVIGLAREAGCP
jgi:cytidylate kinase